MGKKEKREKAKQARLDAAYKQFRLQSDYPEAAYRCRCGIMATIKAGRFWTNCSACGKTVDRTANYLSW